MTECTVCEGTGACLDCDGEGVYDDGEVEDATCDYCGGSGECPNCQGSGEEEGAGE